MKTSISLLFAFSFFFSTISAQNLVPNGSFEQKISCPNGWGQIHLATHWNNPMHGFSDSDYLHSCSSKSTSSVPKNSFGYQFARTGNAYAGLVVKQTIYPEVREYIQVKLMDSLQVGKTYKVEFWVSLSNGSEYLANQIGAYFSKVKIDTNWSDYLGFQPQVYNDSANFLADTAQWEKIEGSFVANGGEEYLIIGNFKNDANTSMQPNPNGFILGCAYYYIDDVSVVEDTTVGIENRRGNKSNIKVYPNPSKEVINIELPLLEEQSGKLEIFNIQGKKVAERKLVEQKHEIQLSLVPGIYYFTIKVNEEILKSDKLIIAD